MHDLVKLYKLDRLVYEVFCTRLKAFLFCFFILKSGQDNYWCYLLASFLLLNNLVVTICILYQLLYFLSSLKTTHHRHLQIHEYESIWSLRTLARFIKSFFIHFNCDFAIRCFFYFNIKMLFNQKFQRQDVELYVIYD